MVVGIAVVLPARVVPAGGSTTVSQKDRAFAPNELTVTPGAVVHIVNDDNVTHHVYVDSPQMKFDSGEQPIGATVDLQFDQKGTFQVRCAIHPTMRLTVTVK
ncbi:MAG TPA: plastocyanin/azurin family copper-binding protein [Stellaceae bacterium]|nr:plastocyanin/azurin family copper-binding protein [Stellaceae bacterium]